VYSMKPSNTVTGTDPTAGAHVNKGQFLTVWYSEGPKTTITVPSVENLSVFQAEEQLATAHLGSSLAYVSTNTGGAAPGTVIDQVPAANTQVSSGTSVTLTVVASNSTFALPSVAGGSISTASATLGSYELVVSATQEMQCSNSVSADAVSGTVPAAGQLVTAGQSIELIISTGVCQVTVPNVTADSYLEANTTLSGSPYDLVPQFNYLESSSAVCQADGPDYVVSTVPATGSKITPGNSITVNYCPPADSTTTSTTGP
jgi:beta-lactam-binding protein with PASTA domain